MATLWESKGEREYVRENPLRFTALICALAVCRTLYDVLIDHRFTWFVALNLALLGVFLATYLRKTRFAWNIAVFIVGAWVPIGAILYYLPSDRVSPSAALLTVLVVVWGVWLSYLCWARSRYFRFIKDFRT